MTTFQKVKLGDVVDVIPGFAFKSSDFSEIGKPIIKIKNIQSDFSVSLKNCDYVKDEVVKKKNFDKYKIAPKEALIAMTGATIGKVGRFTIENDIYLNQRVALFRSRKINNDYLWALLRSPKYQDILKSLGGGAAQANMSSFQIEKIEIDLPDLLTQTRVTAVISAYDDLIENNEKRIKALEEMAQLLYTEWFVKPLEKWKITELGRKIEIKKGKNITLNTITNGNIPVVAGGLKPAYYHNKANTLGPVITISASGANAGFVNLYYENIWASDCSYIDSNTTPYPFFYYLFLKCNQTEITRSQRGSAQPHVYPADLMRLRILNIPEDLLKKFEEKIKIVFNHIGNIKKQNSNLSKTRDLLIPQLVTGKRELR